MRGFRSKSRNGVLKTSEGEKQILFTVDKEDAVTGSGLGLMTGLASETMTFSIALVMTVSGKSA